jgi:acetyl-CoA C-acetyltransferase
MPTFSVESICASGTTGLRVGWSMIKAGLHKIVAVIGFQKMSELTSREVAEMMGRGSDLMWETPFGMTAATSYALCAQAHMAKYGTTAEQLAKVRVKNSLYGARNPKATYRKELTIEAVLNSEIVSSPLKKFDCCANADGASCVILARGDIATHAVKTPIWIMGLGAATDAITLSQRETLTSFCSARAAKEAYAMAAIKPEDVDVAEVHDAFTIAEIIAYEDLGFAKPGEGARLIGDQETYLNGKIPVNIDGGLLSKGHPVGATGGSQIRTIVRQLRGEATEAQVPDAEIGLVHNVGGTGYYSNVIVLRR